MNFNGFLPYPDLDKYTLVPNQLFDDVMANIDSLAELKVVLAIFRATYGFMERNHEGTPVYTRAKRISYARLREITHLSDSAIADGLKKAMEHGYIVRIEAGSLTTGGSMYAIAQVSDMKQDGSEINETVSQQSMASDSELTTYVEDKEQVIVELLGTKKEEPKPRKRGRLSYKDKPLSQWTCNDILAYFGARYREFVGIPYPMFSGKDRKQAKLLLEDSNLSVLDIVKAINYYLKNYKNIKGIPEGYPSWAVFYGWRNTLIPLALVGNKERVDVRQYQEGQQEWVPNSWEGE